LLNVFYHSLFVVSTFTIQLSPLTSSLLPITSPSGVWVWVEPTLNICVANISLRRRRNITRRKTNITSA
ncbi:MAG: hypothetical protein IJD88_06170, partial [Clostridia bacterium]|nr:hypothetical protein [Clostridia bacterium]